MKKQKAKTSIKRIVVIAILTISVCVAAYCIIADLILSNAVPRAALLGFSPSDHPKSAESDPQTESHTCGFHSLRSVYRAYGLDPDEHSLRIRLGVDVAANPADETTTGVIQPDLTRVMAQDGFLISSLDLEAGNAAKRLEAHLVQPQLALALIVRPANGHMHYIVLQCADAGKIELIDPLSASPEQIETLSFLNRQAVTVFLIGPEPSVSKESIQQAHWLGVLAMKDTPERVNVLKRLREKP